VLVAVGENSTLKLYSPPAATETGRLPSPLTEKLFPDTVIFETCTDAVPVFLREMLVLAVPPIDTPPKLTTLGDACRDRALVAAPAVSPQNEKKIKTQNKGIRRPRPSCATRARRWVSW
jgi:hypothetical protein